MGPPCLHTRHVHHPPAPQMELGALFVAPALDSRAHRSILGAAAASPPNDDPTDDPEPATAFDNETSFLEAATATVQGSPPSARLPFEPAHPYIAPRVYPPPTG